MKFTLLLAEKEKSKGEMAELEPKNEMRHMLEPGGVTASWRHILKVEMWI